MPRVRRAPAAPAAAPAAPVAPAPPAPHWQVARLAEPGQVFETVDIRGARTRVVADARGVVIPGSAEECALVDRLPVAPADVLAAPIPEPAPIPDIPDSPEPTDDADADAGEED